MSDQLPPPGNQEPSSAAWWPASRWGTTQRLIAILGVVLLIAVIVGSLTNDDGDGGRSPSKSTELCAVLRDPENRNLTRGDFERLADMTETELQRYVASRCPDQSDRVD
jgi:hypothetical protein